MFPPRRALHQCHPPSCNFPETPVNNLALKCIRLNPSERSRHTSPSLSLSIQREKLSFKTLEFRGVDPYSNSSLILSGLINPSPCQDFRPIYRWKWSILFLNPRKPLSLSPWYFTQVSYIATRQDIHGHSPWGFHFQEKLASVSQNLSRRPEGEYSEANLLEWRPESNAFRSKPILNTIRKPEV